jgi:TM2 domain-containing membrane protein YozV
MFCSKCGAQTDATAQFCSKCGASTAVATESAPARPSELPANYSATPQPQIIIVRSQKSSGLAAVLSFFWCGLGQIYNGQIGKGLIFGFLYLISWFLIIIGIGLLTTPILWIYGMVDAYRTSEQMNQDSASKY